MDALGLLRRSLFWGVDNFVNELLTGCRHEALASCKCRCPCCCWCISAPVAAPQLAQPAAVCICASQPLLLTPWRDWHPPPPPAPTPRCPRCLAAGLGEAHRVGPKAGGIPPPNGWPPPWAAARKAGSHSHAGAGGSRGGPAADRAAGGSGVCGCGQVRGRGAWVGLCAAEVLTSHVTRASRTCVSGCG